MRQKSLRRNGFSLVEIIVVVAVFSVTVLVATNIFLLSSRSQRLATSAQKIQGDIRFALEAIAREVRFGTIDYDCYDGVPPACDPSGVPINLEVDEGLTNLLAIVDSSGNKIRFMVDPFATIGSSKLYVCLEKAETPSIDECQFEPGWEQVTPEGVKVIPGGTNFYISPHRSPFVLCDPVSTGYLKCQVPAIPGDPVSPYLTDEQPRVTVTIQTEQEVDEIGKERSSMQTTITSRVFVR